jgi:hypothetical protein
LIRGIMGFGVGLIIGINGLDCPGLMRGIIGRFGIGIVLIGGCIPGLKIGLIPFIVFSFIPAECLG